MKSGTLFFAITLVAVCLAANDFLLLKMIAELRGQVRDLTVKLEEDRLKVQNPVEMKSR